MRGEDFTNSEIHIIKHTWAEKSDRYGALMSENTAWTTNNGHYEGNLHVISEIITSGPYANMYVVYDGLCLCSQK